MPKVPRVSPGRVGRQQNTRHITLSPSRKRDRYVLQACNRCREAKVRCDGGLPCAYCTVRSPEACCYNMPRPPNFQTEFTPKTTEKASGTSQIQGSSISTLLQEQNEKLDTLIERITALERGDNHFSQPWTSDVDADSSTAEQPLPLFQSSTNALFSISIVDTNLKALENLLTGSSPGEGDMPSRTSFSIVQGNIVDELSSDIAQKESKHVPITFARSVRNESHASLTWPLEVLGSKDVIRRVYEYQDLVGMMYPVVDIAYIGQRAQELLVIGEEKEANLNHMHKRDRTEVAILKMMVAITLIPEGDSRSELVQGLYNSLWPEVESMIWNTKVDLKGFVLLVLVAIYNYHSNNWRMAWRLVGNIARIILELGLNQQIVLDRAFPNPKDHSQAATTIWAVFVLQEQLSYSLGLSIALRDLHLDLTFPRPVDAPYLEAMIQYSHIGSQDFQSLLGETNISHPGPSDQQDFFSFSQYRLQEWCKCIATDFQYKADGKKTNLWNRHLQIMLHLRANNLRTVIARYFLCGNGTLKTAPTNIWIQSVDVATEKIQILANIDRSSTTYRLHQGQTNYFLITALGILLLALTRDSSKHVLTPQTENSTTAAIYVKAQQNVTVALNLLYTQVESSHQSRDLWERVRGLVFRLDLLKCLVPVDSRASYPVNGEQTSIMMEPDPGATIINHAQLEEINPINLEPIELNVDMSGLTRLLETSPSANGITADLDSIFDSSFLTNQL